MSSRGGRPRERDAKNHRTRENAIAEVGVLTNLKYVSNLLVRTPTTAQVQRTPMENPYGTFEAMTGKVISGYFGFAEEDVFQ